MKFFNKLFFLIAMLIPIVCYSSNDNTFYLHTIKAISYMERAYINCDLIDDEYLKETTLELIGNYKQKLSNTYFSDKPKCNFPVVVKGLKKLKYNDKLPEQVLHEIELAYYELMKANQNSE